VGGHSVDVGADELAVEVGVESSARMADPAHGPETRPPFGGFRRVGESPRRRPGSRGVKETSVPATNDAEAAFARYVIPEVDVLYRVALIPRTFRQRRKAQVVDLGPLSQGGS
jgi:hypothetical protein